MKNLFKNLELRFDFIVEYFHSHNKYRKYLFFTLLTGVFLILFYLNIKTPMTGDDYPYSFIFETTQRISSFSDIIQSQYLHYHNWGGRSVVHIIAQLLLFLDNPVLMDAVNALAFTLFIYLIYLHSVGTREYNIRLLVIIFVSVWLLQPVFAETVLWITGSANYLWGSMIILLFLLPYRLYKDKNAGINIKNILLSIMMFLGGIIAGWTNENTAAGMIVMIIMYIIYYRYSKYRIAFWVYIGLVGAVIGYCIMISAPGNFVRAEGTSISPFHIIYRLLTSTQRFVEYLGILNLGVAILYILYLKFFRKTTNKVAPLIIIYYAGVFVSIYSMVASPGFPARTWFGPITLNIIVLGIMLYNQDYKQVFISRIKNAVTVFCVVSFLCSFYDANKDISRIDRLWKERMIVIEKKKGEGAKDVVFKPYHAATKFGLGDAPYAKKYMSNYYGINFELED